MDRAVRLANLWNWLPAFRILAETEHLPTAARQLHLTPSSVSRSIKLLEDQLGYLLFVRTARALRLNDAGRALLAAVRDAMRTIDNSLVEDNATSTRIRIAGQQPWLELLVVSGVGTEGETRPHTLELFDTRDDDVSAALLRGQIDIALTESIEQRDGVVVERLGSVARGLCHKASLRLERTTRHAVLTTTSESWPADTPREVGLRSAQLGTILDACAGGRLAAVLPVCFAKARKLRVSSVPSIAPSTLYLARRAGGAPPWIVEWIRRQAKLLLT
ncbi:LysR family transcriptional regulator [soil metagenome]